MNDSIIFVEGPADAVFINDLIYHLMPVETVRYREISKFKKGRAIQIQDKPIVKLFVSGGCSHIELFYNKIIEFKDLGYNIILIQDADNSIKDPFMGGFEKRMKYLEDFKTKYSIAFETFLLPNHNNDGDLESILENLVLKDKYKPFIENYQKYCLEIANFSTSEHSNELLETKYKIFGYCQVYHGMAMANETKRDYHNNHWNLDHPSLQVLKDFLITQIGI